MNASLAKEPTISAGQKITPFLWFDGQAEAAARFYTSIFPDSEVTRASPMIVNFRLCGLEFMGLNGGPHFKFTEAVSFFISCETQAEVDYFWDKILAGVPAEQRTVLEGLRRTIHAAAPGAEEYIGYGLAGFKLDGRPLVYFDAWKDHCAFYPASPATQEKFSDELKGLIASKGTIRFTPESPLPLALVKKLVLARVAENKAKSISQKSSTKTRTHKPKQETP